MTGPMTSFVIAIDGPVAAGKGTLARLLAARFGYAYLDTGALYRAVGSKVLRLGGDPADANFATKAAENLTADDLTAPDLRAEAVGLAASKVASIPGVRAALLDYQRRYAAHPPGGEKGAVLDGRDIGTVVCPDAPVKLFVTASDEVRAGRREERRRVIDQRIASEIERRRAAGLRVPTPEEEARLRARIERQLAAREQRADAAVAARRETMQRKVENGEALTREDITGRKPISPEMRERFRGLRDLPPGERAKAWRDLSPEERRALAEELRARRAVRLPPAPASVPQEDTPPPSE